MIFFQYLLFITVSLAFITTDTGFFLQFDNVKNSQFKCKNGQKTSSTVQFSGQFANPPQVILTVEKIDQDNINCNISLNIQNITTSKFDLYIECKTGSLVATRLRWFAIDDTRVQVINMFDQTSFENKSIPHQNPNVAAGFISLLDLSFSGPLNFYISISQITQYNVSIQIDDPNAKNVNLNQLSYQIILVPPEKVTIGNILNLTSNYQSPDITLPSNTYFMIATQGFIYSKGDNIRLNITYNNLSPIQYSFDCWYGTYIQNINRQIQFGYAFTIQYPLLKCDNIRVSQGQNLQSQSQPLIVFNYQQAGISYSSVGTYSLILDKSLSSIRFQIQVQCQQNKKIISQFYMYPQNVGQQQMKTLYHNCQNQDTFFKVYYPRFIQQMVAYEELSISITSTGFSLVQILYNQVKTQNSLINIQLTDA